MHEITPIYISLIVYSPLPHQTHPLPSPITRMASPRLTPFLKPLAPPNPAPLERVTPKSSTTAPRRRARHISLFRGSSSMRAAAAAAHQEPPSPRVNCAGQVRAAPGGGSPDYAFFCFPASTAASKRPFKWLSLFPFRRDRRRQVSEETTTAMVVKDERARYLVRPPGEASTSSPPANALMLMRCRSVGPNSKLRRATARRRV